MASLQELANVRRKISDISARISEIESASLTREDVETNIKGFIQTLQARFDQAYVGMAAVSANSGLSALDIMNACSYDEHNGSDKALVIQAWMNPELLEKRLLECAEPYMASGKSALPTEKRPALIRKLDSELSELLHTEESLIVALTDAGHEVFRRGNVDPLVVLAASAE